MTPDRRYYPLTHLHSHASAALSWLLRGDRAHARAALSHLDVAELDAVSLAACLLVSAAGDIADALRVPDSPQTLVLPRRAEVVCGCGEPGCAERFAKEVQ